MDRDGRNEYMNWELSAQEKKRQMKLPEWAAAERYGYVDSFVEWWFHRKK